MPDYPYTARRGLTVLAVGSVVGIGVLLIAPSRYLERLKIDSPKLPATFALASVSLDWVRYFRSGKPNEKQYAKVPVRSQDSLKQGNKRRKQ